MKKLDFNEIVSRCELRYNAEYSYRIVSPIRNVHSKILLNCSIHGENEIIIWDHLRGSICKECANKNRREKQYKGSSKFIEESIKIWKEDVFDYSYIDYKNNRTKVSIRCIKHNVTFEQTPNEHLNKHNGCNLCKHKSIGEMKIASFLDKKNVLYCREYRFDDCKSKYRLPFDFYIHTMNTCIEFDGIQHYEMRFNSEKEFSRTKLNDAIKTKYCSDNKITLIRIPYFDINNIDNILNKILNNQQKENS